MTTILHVTQAAIDAAIRAQKDNSKGGVSDYCPISMAGRQQFDVPCTTGSTVMHINGSVFDDAWPIEPSKIMLLDNVGRALVRAFDMHDYDALYPCIVVLTPKE